MSQFYKHALLYLLLLAGIQTTAQTIVRGKIIDAATREPIAGATISCSNTNCRCGCTTNISGEFQMKCTSCFSHSVSSIGYATQQFSSSEKELLIQLNTNASPLQELVFTANRGVAQKRSEAPIAISTISNKTINDTKAITADQLLNKVSGVNMVSLGNEQHQMSIRQPMTTKSLFLYLEDGIPVRTSGLYNHNALLEMNMAATKSIEVIKGPSSSLYGSEAIGGVVNFITAAPTTSPVLKLSLQGNDIGYNRVDLLSSISTGKWGFMISGYYADKRNGFLEYSDFHKDVITARIDYRFSDKTTLTNTVTWLKYDSDMSGSIDSNMFANKSFTNLQTFTYRKVDALRYRSTISHSWNSNSNSSLSILYRDNAIGQNPAYRIKDDYRKLNGSWVGRKDLAHGEINESGFNSYALIAQHRHDLMWKKAVFVAGANIDLSPSSYASNYIRIKKDTLSRKNLSYQSTDSSLTSYTTKLNNYAAFASFEFSPIEKLRIVASLRYDYFHYGFDNKLKPSAFSGSPDTINHFSRLSPKIGFTYNFSGRTGIYANYSEGFVPPQVTELYTGVKVPNLNAAVFYNYEIGGWMEIVKGLLSADISAYNLRGTNEVVSVKMDDGSYANQNAGKTLHMGIEAGLNANILNDLSFRISGAFSKHEFVDFIEKGVSYNGNEMSNAPKWIYNAECWYRPSYLKGLRLGAELQYVGKYFVDPKNTSSYEGYKVLNLRAGYRFKGVDLWLNLINAANRYYSTISSKSNFGYSYQLGEPRNINVGLSYDFSTIFKK